MQGRTGLIVKELMSYGKAAREVLPVLKAMILQFIAEGKAGAMPEELNARRIASLDEAIKSVETATSQPELRSFSKVQAPDLSWPK